MTISQDIRSLNPSSLIELFELYISEAEVVRFHNGLNELNSNVIWDGNTYSFFPIQATGFEFSGKGQLPRPTLTVANVTGLMGAMVRDYNDLLGMKFVRRRTLLKYLDAVNFVGGTNPTADPTAELLPDVYYIDRKSKENKILIEFELAARFDVANIKLPRRQIVQNVCPWKYRGAECGYTGTTYFTINNVSTVNPAEDVCNKSLTACQLRFGVNNEIPYGGFPSVGLIK